MLFVLVALWCAGTILLLSDGRSSRARWLAGVTFSGGFGALAALLDEYAMPYALQHGYQQGTIQFIVNATQTSSLLSYYGLPYTFLMFGIRYHPAYKWLEAVRTLPILLLLPVPLCLLLIQPIYPISYPVVSLWAVPYVLSGTFLILSKKEPTRMLRRNHLLTALAVVPAVLFGTSMNYVLASFGILQMWRYNTWAIAFAFTIFLYSLFKYGFLGIQILIQRRKLDFTLRAITSGTAILNHSIKNDVGKMKLFSEKIKRYAEQSGQQELADDIRVVIAASQHIQDMITRVHGQTQELALKPAMHKPADLIIETLESLDPMLTRISVHISLADVPVLVCDRAQVTEVLSNVIVNAAEAMPGGGELHVRLYDRRRHVVIEVRDTGEGMDKQRLKQVLEPFFTTKTNGAGNFGLGLAYCYNVMSRHGGTMELDSKPGQGTAVFLQFPKKSRGAVAAHGNTHSSAAGRG